MMIFLEMSIDDDKAPDLLDGLTHIFKINLFAVALLASMLMATGA